MKSPRPLRAALLVAALLSFPALTTACAQEGREGAAADQAALHKALSSVAAPQGLTVSSDAAKACAELSPDCPSVYSSITYVVDHGNLKPCLAVVALQGSIPAATVRWRGPASDGKPAVGGTVAHPTPAVLMAACTKSMSTSRRFMMRSDLDPHAIPVKSARAILMVLPAPSDMTLESTDLQIILSLDAPAAFAEPQ